MAKDWTEEEIRGLISDSVRIVHEDRERSTYKSLHEKYGEKQETAPEAEPKEGDPPPAKDPKKSAAQKEPRKLWHWSEDG